MTDGPTGVRRALHELNVWIVAVALSFVIFVVLVIGLDLVGIDHSGLLALVVAGCLAGTWGLRERRARGLPE